MPFTFSHPAAVIPFAGSRYFIFSALVIGSMTPDFDSFLHLSADVTFGHSFPGLFLFCIPSGILIFLIFHFLLKYPLISLFPSDHQKRLLNIVGNFKINSVSQWGCIIISLTAGALTHILWDSAAHEYGFLVVNFPILKESLYDFHTSQLKIYTVLQHGGTPAGGFFLIYQYRKWYKKAPVSSKIVITYFSAYKKFFVITLIASGGISIGIIYAVIKKMTIYEIIHEYNCIKGVVLMGIPAIFLGTVLFSIFFLLIIKP